ncbi:hypothetical protein Ae406Ps2_3063 [Pseudonocardia sp. Ae406_Ps2]|nr:hypothetical protein Ae331Ps2_2864c [Pseudonocardia sp. Ae331_Ps2]OLM03063.1 hypothetical protein Ae406Ps2_3063 [Pseudonocardia sp. Ae406_Ps2]OLM12070.1 hypothetical protein Ae505Ps2_2196c [Pseudonocardia sp. Ae505_Ps2]OLM24617.1 hypothetical protein Ae706Ps2_3050 [Pseudonocardia sp. Ae706_Ps2]
MSEDVKPTTAEATLGRRRPQSGRPHRRARDLPRPRHR